MLKKTKISIFKFGSIVAIAAMLLICYLSIPSLNKYEHNSAVLYDKDKNIIAYRLSFDDKFRFKTNIEDVDPLYIKMLLAAEDERFYYHLGVDPIAIIRAFFNNISGNSQQGASTIAMQVQKLLEKKERNIISKIKEAIGSVLMTLYYGREYMLNIYLTTAPFGSNIEGVKAASLMYFNHDARRLSPDEAALLVALPRLPEKIRPDKNPKLAKKYRDLVLHKAYQDGIIKQDVYLSAVNEHVPYTIKRPKQSAYHLLNLALTYTNQNEIYSFIDPNIQNILYDKGIEFKNYSRKKDDLGIVAIDNQKHTLSAYLGSKDRFINEYDMANALRSPGSALKPFVYALAFDRNIVFASSSIKDNQSSFGNWLPQNFDRDFKGQISIEDALTMSLNIPSLKLLEAIGPQSFVNTIDNGQGILNFKGKANVAIATGGLGIKLLDLANLYTSFVNQGKLEPLALFYVKEQSGIKTFYLNDITTTRNLFNDQAAIAVYNILTRTKRPIGFDPFNKTSFKTGTSYNFIDATSVGTKGNITIALRSGNTDASSNEPYTGFNRAAPILFSIFDKLNLQDNNFEISLYEKAAPFSLQNFYISDESYSKSSKQKSLKILHPNNNDIVYAIDNKVYLEIEGGIEPYSIFVNDKLTPFTDHFEVQTFGLYKIIVKDGADNAVTLELNIKLM